MDLNLSAVAPGLDAWLCCAAVLVPAGERPEFNEDEPAKQLIEDSVVLVNAHDGTNIRINTIDALSRRTEVARWFSDVLEDVTTVWVPVAWLHRVAVALQQATGVAPIFGAGLKSRRRLRPLVAPWTLATVDMCDCEYGPPALSIARQAADCLAVGLCDLQLTCCTTYRRNYLALLGRSAEVRELLQWTRQVRGRHYHYQERREDRYRDVRPFGYKLASYSVGLQVFNAVVDEFERLLCLWALCALEQATGQECGRDIKRMLCDLVLGLD